MGESRKSVRDGEREKEEEKKGRRKREEEGFLKVNYTTVAIYKSRE